MSDWAWAAAILGVACLLVLSVRSAGAWVCPRCGGDMRALNSRHVRAILVNSGIPAPPGTRGSGKACIRCGHVSFRAQWAHDGNRSSP